MYVKEIYFGWLVKKLFWLRSSMPLPTKWLLSMVIMVKWVD